MAPGAAPPVHGEGWRPDQPGPPRPPRAGLAVARRRGRPLPPPLGRPRPPPAGDGFGGPAHPPLPRLPPSQHPRASFKNSRWAGPSRSGRLWPPLPGSQCQRRAGDKSSIFLALLGWRRGLPSALGSWPACLRVAGVAEAAATPAGTEGTGGRRWPQPRRPRAGARAGPPLPAAGPGWGDGRRLHCLAVDQLSVLLRPVPSRCEPGRGWPPLPDQLGDESAVARSLRCGSTVCLPGSRELHIRLLRQTTALDERGCSKSTSRKLDACRGLRKTLQHHVTMWPVFATCLAGRAAQEASSLRPDALVLSWRPELG
ncbi:basic proline-rich protein isoform X4 [Bos taurus]|uniref:basic proline-rich protein isoform X4 n=1 Tax=Bos taurus TaxID=9913 RepID=UPI000D532B6C|nr:basic proline-rich protein isoform X4 [Bos taurus]XP_024848599.1 basic proline-rich protein isoform X4 [Bos taurus]XP_059743187.1 basic proline-rich protein isoform X4 [Bos taurus]